jgi:phosphate transport system substrate-binding protein
VRSPKTRTTLALAGVTALGLVAAACGDDSSGSGATTVAATTTAAAATTTAAATTAAPTTTAAATTTTTKAPSIDYKSLKGTLNGSGATFPKAFYDEAIAEFKKVAPGVTVNYGAGGSGKGRQDFADQVTDWGASDGVVKAEDKPKYKGGDFVYIPTVIAPITISYNLDGVDKLQLSPDTIAKIFQLQVKTWNDPAIAADNPGVTLPATPITVAVRADSSGTTENFSIFLDLAAGDTGSKVWTLKRGSTIQWPAGVQAGQGNSGVAKVVKDTKGGIGYVDYSDAKATGLKTAAVKNKAGKFVAPTLEATTAAAEGAKINDDLTFLLAWADGDKTYPIAAQTWILAYKKMADPDKAAALRGFLTWMLTDGQKLAPKIDFAPLPGVLDDKGLAAIKTIGA